MSFSVALLYNVSITLKQPYDYITSESLFGAILSALDENTAKDLLVKHDFAVSSLFPFVKSNNKVILFSKFVNPFFIMDKLNFSKNLAYPLHKKIKAATYFSLDFISGNIEEDSFQNFLNKIYNNLQVDKDSINDILNNCYFLTKSMYDYFFPTIKRDKILVSRKNVTSSKDITEIYTDFTIISSDESGFWFAFPEKYEHEIKKALNYLKYFGLGSDKNIGREPFEKYKILPIEKFYNFSKNSSYVTNLSLYYPKKDEFELFFKSNKLMQYSILPYSGWIEFTRTFPAAIIKRKPLVYFFEEGSIFPKIKDSFIYGSRVFAEKLIVNDSKEEDIYYHGTSLMIPVVEGDKQ